ncbi:hypothetical protein B0H10DRAFT_472339 [Mycena sp. CBHHK59/15]|nr:hypothetical protein B0H10DRAFT_927447 [Mycena sp. CBHHK59/15]KAJ6627035.1 hypothetical protein B0H10DRAFT_472339 [Mycena sp. CBHHK59/15]
MLGLDLSRSNRSREEVIGTLQTKMTMHQTTEFAPLQLIKWLFPAFLLVLLQHFFMRFLDAKLHVHMQIYSNTTARLYRTAHRRRADTGNASRTGSSGFMAFCDISSTGKDHASYMNLSFQVLPDTPSQFLLDVFLCSQAAGLTTFITAAAAPSIRTRDSVPVNSAFFWATYTSPYDKDVGPFLAILNKIPTPPTSGRASSAVPLQQK